MSLRILWHPAALHTFHRLPMHSATLADRAVQRFAETGEGELAWDPPYHRLRAGFHDAMLAIDLRARTVTVIGLYRARHPRG